MDEAQIRALVQQMLEANNTTLSTTLMNQVNTANSGLAASLERQIKKLGETPPAPQPQPQPPQPDPTNPTSETDKGRLSLKALETQLQEQAKQFETLQSQLKEKEVQAFEARKRSSVSEAIAKAGTINQGLLHTAFLARNGGQLTEENGIWYVKNGEQVATLDDAMKGYLGTDEGKVFVPASTTQGAGSTESKTTTPTPEPTTKAGEALAAAF
ncbi:hypothetical protein IQ268_08930 [Oculatella sp. LEGE 06141]|uniref:hypothetical protein n=1 Tax=Oculatella sp. LEGE 06141 TaxID=1828648 RepID=UPI00187F3629|nr:hypothetical protein [Oculatella sp. LEGE 06141]MBE9178682.1 hypothetical protein [Oculatella sp. LEGE 06141]